MNDKALVSRSGVRAAIAVIVVLFSSLTYSQTATETRRPTQNVNGSGNLTTTDVSAAYNNNLSDAGTVSTTGQCVNQLVTRTKERIVKTWQTPTHSYLSLVLKYKCSVWTSDPETTAAYITWSATGTNGSFACDSTVRSQSIPANTSLSTLQIELWATALDGEIITDDYGENPHCSAGNASSSVFEVWTEGIYATSAPAAPSGLTATSIGNGTSVSLQWTDNATAESTYKIQRCTGQACTPTDLVTGLAVDSVSYTDGTTAAGSTYGYAACAVNSLGSSCSSVAYVTTVSSPAAPSGLTVSPNGSSAALSWTDNATNETSYKVQRCVTANCAPTDYATGLAANSNGYADTIVAGDTYGYSVCAVNALGAACSAIAYLTADAPPAAPSNLAAVPLIGEVSLSWSDNSANETGFAIESCSGDSCANFQEIARTGASVTSVADTTVVAGGHYSYRVRAVGTGGFSGYSAVASAIVSSFAPPTLSLSTPYVTRYKYDTLGNLTCVEQHGPVSGTGCDSDPAYDATSSWRVRRFTYNSLSQLLTSKNPEAGLISYVYDDDGDVAAKTDARGITVAYAYDEIHRLLGKSYSNGDAPVAYVYDAGENGIGRRTGMVDRSAVAGFSATGTSAVWTYDLMGRATGEARTIGGVTKTIGYDYDDAGSVTAIRYPYANGETPFTVTYAYDEDEQLISATGSDGVSYVGNAVYTPHGAIQQYTLNAAAGQGAITLYEDYNNRLQTTAILATTAARDDNCASSPGKLLHLRYRFSDANRANNGNVLNADNCRDLSRSASYSYDGLNRLLSAQTPTGSANTWSQSFRYDAWGNLLEIQGGGAPGLLVTANNRNQIEGEPYDAAGDLLRAPVTGGALTYDAESRLATAAGVSYVYDGDGERVAKNPGKVYWSGSGADALVESDASGTITAQYIFFGGKRVVRRDDLAQPTPSLHFYFSDHLGSASVIANAGGTSIEEESDYYPFGGERSLITGPNAYKFTGKERDPETALDYFGARYYSSAGGRFLSADWSVAPTAVPYAKLSDPQTLNLFTYVRNVPTLKVDPDGHCPDICPLETLLQPFKDLYDKANAAVTDVSVALAKEAGNQVIDAINGSAPVAPIHVLSGGDPSSGPIPRFESSNATQQNTMTAASIGFALIPLPGDKPTQLHHIATDKALVSGFARQFERIFARAGLTLQDKANLMSLPSHLGRHTNAYHAYVLERLKTATSGLSGTEYKQALLGALKSLKTELEKNPLLVKMK